MREGIVRNLQCPCCGAAGFELKDAASDEEEIRAGAVVCGNCRRTFPIEDGIINLLWRPTKGADQERNIHPQVPIDDVLRYTGEWREQLLSLPEGDGSEIFDESVPLSTFEGRCSDTGVIDMFRHIKRNAGGFYEAIRAIDMSAGPKILELGPMLCWSLNRMARRGARCVGLDVTRLAKYADVYIKHGNVYFDRVWADMAKIPFRDGTFDVVLTCESIHHTSHLSRVLSEIKRVLKDGGKAVFVHEPCTPLKAERTNPEMEEAMATGANEHIFTCWDWFLAARRAGMVLDFQLPKWRERLEEEASRYAEGALSPNTWKGRIFFRLLSNGEIRRIVFSLFRRKPHIFSLLFCFVQYDYPCFLYTKEKTHGAPEEGCTVKPSGRNAVRNPTEHHNDED